MSDPITTEVIRGGISWICEEMGIALRNSAYSPNIKERMDHSCAVFDTEGNLVGQAEHIPVHLGSLPWGVKNFLRVLKDEKSRVKKGDVFLFNDPYISGTHLNDLTMVKPVFSGGEVVAWLSVKAHIVDVGGKNPGSISYNSKELFEEGVIIPPVKFVDGGEVSDDIFSFFLANVREPETARGDINAMLSALHAGEKKLVDLVKEYGVRTVRDAWLNIMKTTEKKILSSAEVIPAGERFGAEDTLEFPGNPKIRVNIRRKKDGRLEFDFGGTSPESELPVNAVPGTVLSAVLFVVKSIFDPEGDINEGLIRSVDIKIPQGSLLSPRRPSPVSAGNLETAQRIVDTVLRAFSKVIPEKVPAASQGTMNNIMIGGEHNGRRWAFYETVGGGSGARHGKNGVSAVHTNMTNTMNTPVEVMEKEYPVFFLVHEVRRGSGGAGKWKGGDGIIRGFAIRDGKAKITLLCERRKKAPWGVKGGKSGKKGKEKIVIWEKSADPEKLLKSMKIAVDNVFFRSETRKREVNPCGKGSYELRKGDVVIIFTPGGGGYGKPSSPRKRKKSRSDPKNEK